LHQYLLHLGLENFFSHHYLSKNVQNYFSFIFQIWGPPLHCTSDRPCQLIIFPTGIEKSARIIFFQTFLVHEFFFSVSSARFLFLLLPPPPTQLPHHFSNDPPLLLINYEICYRISYLFCQFRWLEAHLLMI
jgi:hypothetical protein